MLRVREELGGLGVGKKTWLGLAEDAHCYGLAQEPGEELLVELGLLGERGEGDFA